MPAYYSIISYVPSTIRGESVNIGVVAFSGDEKQVVYLENWKRVRCLGGNATELKAICARLEHLSADGLKRAIANWSHSVRFSEPKGSLLDINSLAMEAADRFLLDEQVTAPAYKTKQDVLARVRNSLREAIKTTVSPAATRWLKTDGKSVFVGLRDVHAFDVYASNGEAILGANAISFQVPGQKSLRQQVDAIKWSLEDLREGGNTAALAVVVSEPREENVDLFLSSRKVFEELGASVAIDTKEVDGWSLQMAGRIAQHLPPHMRTRYRGN